MSQKKPLYDFPVLGVADVVALVNEMGAAVDEKQLLNPTSEFVWVTLEAMAQYVLALSREEFEQPAFEKLCKLEYPEMHQESVGRFMSFQAIRQLVISSGISDFGMRDIMLKPDSTRLIRLLSGIINYAEFRKEREEKVVALQDESQLEMRQLVEEEMEQDKSDIAEILAERERQMPEVQQKEAENDALWQEILTLNNEQSVYKTEIRALKEELKTLGEAISGQNYSTHQAKQEASNLRAQIIESPEKLQARIEEKKVAVLDAQAAVEVARSNLHFWREKHEAYAKSEKTLRKLLQLSEEGQKQLSEQKAASKEVKALKTKRAALQEKDRNLDAELAERTIKGRQLQDKIDELDQLYVERTKQEERRLREVKAKYAAFVAKQEVAKTRIAQKKEQVNSLQNQLYDLEINAKSRKQEFDRHIAAVQHKALDYQRALLSVAKPLPAL